MHNFILISDELSNFTIHQVFKTIQVLLLVDQRIWDQVWKKKYE